MPGQTPRFYPPEGDLTLGMAIRVCCFLGGITVRELAEETGYARETVEGVVNGHQAPSRELLDAICAYLRLVPSRLLQFPIPETARNQKPEWGGVSTKIIDEALQA